ncbi:hypothetical protein JTB14_026999 [Gonioctena quinquepunctata]|nr:hypothetical protein JTB14_026999 [Gonioctena quinquepunctata]
MSAINKILKYPEEDMISALQAVEAGMPVKTASRNFNVPRTTLLYKSKGIHPEGRKMGPETILNTEHENLLTEWPLIMARSGFPVSKENFLYSVKKLAAELKVNFENDIPGRKWYEGFLRRHPQISILMAQNLIKSRSSVTEAQLLRWFNEPMDVAVFRTMKTGWKEKVNTWRIEHQGDILKRRHFCPLLNEALQEKVTTSVLMNGFRKCGLFPWNPDVVHTFFPKISKKDHTTNKTSSVGDQGDGYLDVKQFEKFIEKYTLDIFRQHADEENWEGPESDKSLFITWKKIRQQNNIIEMINDAEVIFENPHVDIDIIDVLPDSIPVETALDDALTNCLLENTFDNDFSSDNFFDSDPLLKPIPNVIVQPNTSSITNTSIRTYIDFDPILDPPSNVVLPETISTTSRMYKTPPKTNPFSEIFSKSGNFNVALSPSDQLPRSMTNIHPIIESNEEKNTIDPNIPSPFKRALFWPETTTVSNKKKKEKIPSVVTSQQWQEYSRKKMEKKQNEERKKEENKREWEETKLLIENKRPAEKKKTVSVQSSSSNLVEGGDEGKIEEKKRVLGPRRAKKNTSVLFSSSYSNERKEEKENQRKNITEHPAKICLNDFVIVKYDSKQFPGQVKDINNENEYLVSVMVRSGPHGWRWAEKKDEIWYPEEDVLEKICPPTVINSRGIHVVPAMAEYPNI